MILVIYVGVVGIRSEDIPTYCEKLTMKIMPTTFDGEVITIPVQSVNTKIECINPQYVTDTYLIENHELLMKELNKNLQIQLELLKADKNEK